MRATVMLVLAATAGPVLAQAPGEIPPGMWEIRSSMTMPGMPAGMGEQTHRFCVKTGEKRGWSDAATADSKHGCKPGATRVEGNKASFELACKDGTKVSGTVTSNGKDSFTSTMNMAMQRDGKSMTMTQTQQGKRVGDCN